mgnify:FL=1
MKKNLISILICLLCAFALSGSVSAKGPYTATVNGKKMSATYSAPKKKGYKVRKIKKIKNSNTIDDVEGVWMAVGSASSNPTASLHETLRYKEPDGGIRSFDVQGLTTDTPCEEHQCQEKLIDLH